MKKIEYAVIGAGPGGVQMGYYLQRNKMEYAIFEGKDVPCSFFSKYPRSRQLISINKRNLPDVAGLGVDPKEFAYRHDWNSLRTDDDSFPRFTTYTNKYYPDADVLVQYLNDFIKHYAIDIRYNHKLCNVERQEDETFHLHFDVGEEKVVVHAKYLVIATGLSVIKDIVGMDIPEGIERMTYETMPDDPSFAEGKNVAVIGGANSAFETMNSLRDYAAQTYLMNRSGYKLAYESHYPGNVRSINAICLDQFYMKSLDYVQHGNPHEKAHCRFYGPPSFGNKSGNFFDILINCTGLHPDLSYAGDLVSCGPKFPRTTPFYESVSTKNIFFAGTLMHGLDAKKSSGGLIHGFRHLIRMQVEYLKYKNHGIQWPKRTFGMAGFNNFIMKRCSETCGLFQCYGTLCDVFVPGSRPNTIDLLTELPNYLDLGELRKVLGIEDRKWICKITFEFRKGWEGAEARTYGALGPMDIQGASKLFHDRKSLIEWADDNAVFFIDGFSKEDDCIRVVRSEFIHPVFRFYDRNGQLLDVMHISEQLASIYTYSSRSGGWNATRAVKDRYVAHLSAIIAQLERGYLVDVLGHGKFTGLGPPVVL